MPGVKKKILLVKSLRDLSPKKTLLVSHDVRDAERDDNTLGPSSLGNHSPHKPEKTRDQKSYLSRSILGSPSNFDQMSKTKGTGFGGVGSRPGSRGRGATPASPMGGGMNTTNISIESGGMSAGDDDESLEPEEEEMDEAEYMHTINRQKNHSIDVRAHDVEQDMKLTKYLRLSEKIDSGKEKKVMSLWQERLRDWQKIENGIGRKIKSGPSHSLMMQKSDEYRAKSEQYDLLQAAVPEKDRMGAQWEVSLRFKSLFIYTVGIICNMVCCISML